MKTCYLCGALDAKQILYFRNHIQCCDDITEYICKKCDEYWSEYVTDEPNRLDEFWEKVKILHQADYHTSIDITI